MKVKLITYTPDPEQTIAVAARLCYSPATIDEVSEQLTPEKSAKFVEMLSDLGHDSPVEHASFTFGIEGVSRSLLAEITRHRIASFSVQSQRYVAENNFSYVTPPAIAEIPEAAEEFQRAMAEDQAHYERLADLLRAKHCAAFEAEGMTPEAAAKAAEKRAIEDARFVLPNACTT
ncbi:MAG: FAD-dependent thymidylate synthase, partial [Clostridia bacterium]|nr:FAD-dependent thymidylate synthase [Clostridia bacterium]